ncbi:hypothetical protein BC937DRAFT_87557 [Endogone sp. FLAS-F59071]|nr:hypothetical protein BC937DRAFT_87557 [Endogone sp. FLAS-F59071]|eukprot:RUS19398.1 hypothetical protein BC937DRAFT_87557 [Endogone sp. FLAS-F59071]
MPSSKSATKISGNPASSSSVYTYPTANTSSTSVSTYSDSPKVSSFHARVPPVPLTPENLTRHTRLVRTSVRQDPFTLTIEKYQESLLSITADSPTTEAFERPKTDKKKKKRKIQSDYVICPPRALPFPYHNDSMFLPVAEQEQPNSDPRFSNSSLYDLRRTRSLSVPRVKTPPIDKSASLLERSPSARKPAYEILQAPLAPIESTPIVNPRAPKPLPHQRSPKKSASPQRKSSNFLVKLWRFLVGSRKQNKVEPPRPSVVLLR